MSHDIYLRAHTVQLDEKEPWERGPHPNDPKWPDHALVLDCESRITPDQTLTFGFWSFCELRDNRYVCTEEGIFHDDKGLSAPEFDVLRKYARATKPDTTDDGCDRLRLYSRSKFVAEVLGIAIQAKALIVCFNAGFDLSRLALDWEPADNGGWSLILSQWRDPESGELKPNKFFPRIVIKALNSKAAIIHSTRAPMSLPKKNKKKKVRVKLWPAARFLDVRTLAVGASQQIVLIKDGMQGIRYSRQTGRPQADWPCRSGRNRILQAGCPGHGGSAECSQATGMRSASHCCRS